VGSILRILNYVPALAVQLNVGKKPIANSVQAVVLRFLVLPVPAAAEN